MAAIYLINLAWAHLKSKFKWWTRQCWGAQSLEPTRVTLLFNMSFLRKSLSICGQSFSVCQPVLHSLTNRATVRGYVTTRHTKVLQAVCMSKKWSVSLSNHFKCVSDGGEEFLQQERKHLSSHTGLYISLCSSIYAQMTLYDIIKSTNSPWPW